MTDAERPTRRSSIAALVLLGLAVPVGCLFLGAPPRFAAGASGSAGLREFLVALGPLTILEAAAAIALALLVARTCLLRGSPALPGGRDAARARLPLVLLFLLALFQLVPLPRPVLEIVAPYSARTWASLAVAGEDTMRPISLWPAGTAHALFNLAGMIAVSSALWALLRGGASKRAAVIVLAGIAAVALAEAVVGIAATRFGDDRLLGTFEKVSDKGRVTGTFIHATMLAVWTGVGACAAFGLAAYAAFDRRILATGIWVATAAVCGVAAFLSLSRLGFAAAVCGALVIWIVSARIAWLQEHRRVATAMFGGAALLVVAAVVAATSVPAFRERIGYLFTPQGLADQRFPAWRSTWELVRQSPVLGTGLGSFGRAIHLVQSPDSPQELWFAHSDPLNLLSDTGVIGLALALWWLVEMLRRGARALRCADVSARCLAAGALGGAVVVLVASLGDFQTQFPVVALPFAALLTIPAAMEDFSTDDEDPRPRFLSRRLLVGVALALGLAAAALPIAQYRARMHDLADSGVTGATSSEALVAQARASLSRLGSSPDARRELTEAEAKLREASCRDPLLDTAHLFTAIAAHYLDEPQEDVLRALGRARLVGHGHAETNLAVGSTYLDVIGTAPSPYGPPGDGALPALREAGAILPQAFSAAWALGMQHKLSLDELRALTPERGYAQIQLAEHLVAIGRPGEALTALRDQAARDPTDLAVTTRLAALYRSEQREPEGRSFFSSVGATWPASQQ